MTVAQLIEELQKQAPHKPVLVSCEDAAYALEVDAIYNEGSYVEILTCPYSRGT